MKMQFMRRLALLCAVLACGALLALPAAAAQTEAPCAEDGDMDYIRSYVVTVDPREDGSADITYDIDWQVIDGDKTDYLSWVKIGLANSSVNEMTPLTDTIYDLQYSDDGGSYAKVVFTQRYYSPAVAAQNGGESSVRFAFRVHQSHLFTKNDDGTATFNFTPGWFDDLSVENMQVRWRNYDGFVADNTGKPISITNVVRYMTSKGEKISGETVSNYLKYLQDAFLAIPVVRYDIHGKVLLETNNKHYFSDHGIRNYVCDFNMRGSIEKVMENVVWNHLRRQGFKVTVGNLRAGEIDFVATKIDKRIYVQVAYLLASDDTVKREFGNLASIKDNYPKYVVSMDPVAGGFSEYPGIKHIRLREFLKTEF